MLSFPENVEIHKAIGILPAAWTGAAVTKNNFIFSYFRQLFCYVSLVHIFLDRPIVSFISVLNLPSEFKHLTRMSVLWISFNFNLGNVR